MISISKSKCLFIIFLWCHFYNGSLGKHLASTRLEFQLVVLNVPIIGGNMHINIYLIAVFV